MQARYVILQVLLEAGIVEIKYIPMSRDGKADILITLKRELIATVGKKAIGDFLVKLQVN